MEATKSQFGLFTVRLTIVAGLALGMLAAAYFFWPTVTAWQQRNLAVRLVERLKAEELPASRTTLRQIASLGNPAIEALVIATTAERADVALVAREIVDEKLAGWKIRAGAEETYSLVEPVGLLAHALASHVSELGPLGQQWACELSLELVELATELPPADAVSLLADCSKIMETVPAFGPRMRTASRRNLPNSFESAVLSSPDVNLPPFSIETALNSPREVVSQERTPEIEETSPKLASVEIAEATQLPAGTIWVPDWSQQSPTTTPPSEIAAHPAIEKSISTAPPVDNIPSPDEMAAQFEKLKSQDTRTLLVMLAIADRYTAGVIRGVLKERGLAPEELSLAARLVAPESTDRLQLVDDLKILPARTARRWLRELLSDGDAEVRLKALTAFATTNDPELVGIARDIAVRDSDPRVAELASRILRSGAGF